MTRPKSRQGALPGIGGDGNRAVARVRKAFDAQLRAQRATGQVEPVDDGLIGLGRTTADAIDAEVTDPDGSRYTIFTGVRTLLPIMLELRGERRDAASDVGYDAELAALVAAVRDAKGTRPADDG